MSLKCVWHASSVHAVQLISGLEHLIGGGGLSSGQNGGLVGVGAREIVTHVSPFSCFLKSILMGLRGVSFVESFPCIFGIFEV